MPYTYGTIRIGEQELGYNVRPFVPGHSLEVVRGPLVEALVVRAGLQLCDGLAALHSHGLLHLDLKPANIVARRPAGRSFGEHSQCAIIDCAFRSPTLSGEPAVHDVSLHYLPPELAAGEPASHQSDLFSLGVVLYVLATGTTPYQGQAMSEVIAQQRRKQFVGARERNQHISVELDRLLTLLLDPHPHNRPDDASAVAAVLQDLSGEHGYQLPPQAEERVDRVLLPSREACVDEAVTALVSSRSDPGAPALVVRGPQGSGVTTLLERLQDAIEAQNTFVLSVETRGVSRRPAHAQLRDAIDLIVRNRRAGVPSASELADGPLVADGTASDVLNELAVATADHRIAVVIDDYLDLDPAELDWLKRMIQQERASRSGGVSRRGCLFVIVGWSQRSVTAQARDVMEGARVLEVPPVSLEELYRHAQVTVGMTGVSRARLAEVKSECGSNLRACLLGASTAQVSESLSPDGGQPYAGLERDRRVRPAELRDVDVPGRIAKLNDAELAVQLWDDELSKAQWDELRRRLESSDSGSGPVAVAWRAEQQPDGPRVFSRASLGPRQVIAALSADRLDRILGALMRVVCRGAFATAIADSGLALRLFRRVGRVPDNSRWALYRAMLLAARAGRWGDVRSVSTLFSGDSESDSQRWIGRTLTHMAILESGDVGNCPSMVLTDGRRNREGLAEVAHGWLAARLEWRRGNRRQAADRLTRVMPIGESPTGFTSGIIEDLGVLSAELNDAAGSRGAARRLAMAIQRAAQYSVDRPTGLRELARETCGSQAESRLWVRFWRVRGRYHACEGRAARSARCVRRELRLRCLLRDAVGEAACYNNLGVVLLDAGRVSEAIDSFERCVELRQRLDDERGLAAALNNLGLALSMRHDYGQAAAVLSRAKLVSDRNSLQRLREAATLNLAIAQARSGRLRRAGRGLSRMLVGGAEACDRSVRAKALWNSARIALDRWHLVEYDKRMSVLRSEVGQSRRDENTLDVQYLEALCALQLDDAAQLAGVAQRVAMSSSGNVVERDKVAELYRCVSGRLGEGGSRRSGRDHAHRLLASALARERNGRGLRSGSLGRVLKLCRRRGLARQSLMWLSLALRQRVSPCRDAIAQLTLDALQSVELSEGHDDLQAEVRAKVAEVLFAQGRTREGWVLVQDALEWFSGLERKVARWGGATQAVRRVFDVLSEVVGMRQGRFGNASAILTGALRASAFGSLLQRRGERVTSTRIRSEVALESLARTCRGDSEESHVARQVLRAALDLSGAERVLLVRLVGDTCHVVESQSRGIGAGGDVGAHISWSVVRRAIETDSAVISGDALSDEELSSHRSVARLRLRSLVCVPARAGEFVGAVYADHQSIAGLFSGEDVDLYRVVGALATRAIVGDQLRRSASEHQQQLKVFQDNLVAVERMRLMGELAGSAVHDLKNILAAIMARCELILRGDVGDRLRSGLGAIAAGAKSGVELVTKIQRSGKEVRSEDRVGIALADLVKETVDLLSARMEQNGSDAERRIVPVITCGEHVVVKAQRGELREMILNLCVNACDAMPNGGRLEVTVAAEGEHAVLVVSDNGVGMDDAILRRAGEPFFTTKGSKGTGLGLAIVKSVVIRNGGKVSIQSRVGEGTTVKVTLPRCGQ